MSKNKTKLVVIARCADCPVEGCEDRVQCGGIPDACKLEDAAVKDEADEQE